MNIRTYNKKDKENVIRLVKDGLTEFDFDYSKETSESDLANIEKEYLGNNGTFLILENNNHKLIATGAIKEIKKNIYKIRKMYVHKSQRRKGYGKETLIHLLKFAKDKGAKKVVLETSSLMTNAIGLYKNFGFELSKEEPLSPRCDFTLTKNIDYD